jgi:dCTP deaminase
MLSNKGILEAIKKNAISVSPFNENSLRPSALIFHLGKFLLKPVGSCVVDVVTGEKPDYHSIELKEHDPHPLYPGSFILGQTMEKISLNSSYSLLIEGRSTLARLGLTVVQTANLVYPGHRDRAVTLEFANHGPNTINLYYQMKIARGMFFKLNEAASYEYDKGGKYREQEGVGEPIFINEVPKFKPTF